MNEKELSRLNRLVTMFIDYAELMAEDEILMSMQDWVDQTNQFLLNNRRKGTEWKRENFSLMLLCKKLRRNMKYLELNRIENMISEFDREVEKYLKGND